MERSLKRNIIKTGFCTAMMPPLSKSDAPKLVLLFTKHGINMANFIEWEGLLIFVVSQIPAS